MEIEYTLSVLKARAERAPDGRAAAMLARGRVRGAVVAVDEQTHREILMQFPQKVPLKYLVSKLLSPDALRPVGFADFVLSRGRVERGRVVLTRDAHRDVLTAFYPHLVTSAISLKDPSPAELAKNFAVAMADWVRAGYEVVDQAEHERRRAICLECEHWDAGARLGTGKCRVCGCSSVKWWLASSKCPTSPPRW
jgi:hypothetical protein